MNREMPIPLGAHALFVLALALPAAATAAEDLVVGKNAVWVRSVSNRVPGPQHTGSAPRAPLYLWMTYQGSSPALQYLQGQGALPIRHRWSVAVGGEIDIEAPDEAFTEQLSVPLSVGSSSQTVVTQLAGQVATRQSGTFSWRTWSKKESVSRGIWRVEVLYDDDSPVRCDVGGALKPCVFSIRVN